MTAAGSWGVGGSASDGAAAGSSPGRGVMSGNTDDLMPTRTVERLPVLGDIDRQIRTRDGLGVIFALGIVNIGAGIGALMVATGTDPIIYGAIWLTIGMVLTAYRIWVTTNS